jgi:hypothetical protein
MLEKIAPLVGAGQRQRRDQAAVRDDRDVRSAIALVHAAQCRRQEAIAREGKNRPRRRQDIRTQVSDH